MNITLLVNGSYELGSVALHAIGGCVANIHSPINSQCRARHRSTKPSRAMANRGLLGQIPPQTDKLRYQWQGCVVNTLAQLNLRSPARDSCQTRIPGQVSPMVSH